MNTRELFSRSPWGIDAFNISPSKLSTRPKTKNFRYIYFKLSRLPIGSPGGVGSSEGSAIAEIFTRSCVAKWDPRNKPCGMTVAPSIPIAEALVSWNKIGRPFVIPEYKPEGSTRVCEGKYPSNTWGQNGETLTIKTIKQIKTTKT